MFFFDISFQTPAGSSKNFYNSDTDLPFFFVIRKIQYAMHLIVGDFSVFMGKLQLKEQTNKPLRATITRIY